ncbi:FAD-dependent oxidoreductase [Chitinophaga silvisoli]|uniref:FAD-dependent oxidoreductase n=2 Tax=Chitinophaga silvisoli TaxID=2291814 RepID=A0A3E1NTF5_9BACT|nr:FAD-dependent oxidoreductase [Chitinophaga silvisoli]
MVFTGNSVCLHLNPIANSSPVRYFYNMKAKHILISGASIAGPVLGWWLSKYGWQVTIVEQAPSVRMGGYAVDFRGTVLKVLEKMDLMDDIRQHETRTGKITLVNKNNKKIASLPDGFTSGELEIMRGDLVKILYDKTKDRVNYIFNDSIATLNEDKDGVQVTFKHHAPARYDLIVGADGLHSKVRSLIFGHERKFSSFLGIYVAIFTVPNFANVGMDGYYYTAPGKRVGIFGAKDGKEAMASFYFSSSPFYYDRKDTGKQKAIIRQEFENTPWHVPQLLEYMDQSDDFYFDSVSQIKMDHWSKGRIALIGDAAHCPSPMSGMGTSAAVMGAYILAGELMQHDYVEAFGNYEMEMREFVERCQAIADGVDWFVPGTRFKHWMSQQMWKVLPYTPWKNMMVEMPARVANSIGMKEYGEVEMVVG